MRLTRVVIAHNAVAEQDDPSTRDVLEQVVWVRHGLAGLGIRHDVLAVDDGGIDPAGLAGDGVAVFNLVESPPGRPGFQIEVARALERLGVIHTGSRADAIWLTTDKLATRARLAAHDIPIATGGELDPDRPDLLDRLPPPWILKPSQEDASLGLDNGAVTSDRAAAVARARELAVRFGQPVLAEQLLEGREFNLSLLEDAAGVELLPAAEMLYLRFPEGTPRILGWSAKWDGASAASHNTVRRFLPDGEERDLVRVLEATARAAWSACGVAGYARVDLRLDAAGTPRVLEVNANPCLSGDAGFVAATLAAGLDAGQVVRRILAAAGAEP